MKAIAAPELVEVTLFGSTTSIYVPTYDPREREISLARTAYVADLITADELERVVEWALTTPIEAST